MDSMSDKTCIEIRWVSSCPALDGLWFSTKEKAIYATMNSGGGNEHSVSSTDEGTVVKNERGDTLGIVRRA